MKAYLVMYRTDGSGAARLRVAMDRFKMVEHISDHASVVITFYSEEDILDVLDKENKDNAPLFVTALPGTLYTRHLPVDYFEPVSSDKI